MHHTNMNATAETRKRWTEGTPNIVKARVNAAVPHPLFPSSLKLAPKLEPAQFVLESLQQDLQNHIAGHTETMLNLLDDVK